MTFTVDKRLVEVLWMPAVIPELCAAVRDVPSDVWSASDDLYELADRMDPFIEARAGDEARREAQGRINEYRHPQFMASFGIDDSRNSRMGRKWGLKSLSSLQMRNAFHLEVVRVNASLGLVTPDLEESTAFSLEMSATIQREMSGAFEANVA